MRKKIAISAGVMILLSIQALAGSAWPWPEQMPRLSEKSPVRAPSIGDEVHLPWGTPLPMRVFRDPATGEVRIRGTLTGRPDAMYDREADRLRGSPVLDEP